jgi:hypothetical protein
MREHVTTLYKFEELSPQAQETAVNKWRESMDWGFESEQISEDFKYKLEELGYPTDDIGWSLSYSQGDGVAFYGYVDMDIVARRLLEGKDLELYNRLVEENLTVSARIYRNSFGHHYSHWNTMEVEMDGDSTDTMITYLYESNGEELTREEWDDKERELEAFITHLEEVISIDIKTVSRELESLGYKQIEYIESDEAIRETIEANDYEFTSDGIMF